MEPVRGKVLSYDEQGYLVRVPYDNVERAMTRQCTEVVVGLIDGREKSYDQLKKAHSLLRDIADWAGDYMEDVKDDTKQAFNAYLRETYNGMCIALGSLRDADVSTVREYISWLIRFCLRMGVPTKAPLYEMSEDIENYVYACLMHKKCAVCGREPVDIHHFDQIGMGGNRQEMYQIGMRVISLCREHHTIAHDKGRAWLTQELHLRPIPLTAEIGRKYGMNKRNLAKEGA